MVASIWVAELRISDATAAKISSKHGLSVAEVRASLVGVAGLQFAWDEHPARGRRAIVEAFVDGRRVLAVLYPVNPTEGVWNLGSAYCV